MARLGHCVQMLPEGCSSPWLLPVAVLLPVKELLQPWALVAMIIRLDVLPTHMHRKQ